MADNIEREFSASDFRPIVRKKKENVVYRAKGGFYNAVHCICSDKLALCCIAVLLVLTLSSALAFLSPYDPDKMNFSEKLQPPSLAHPFGTDDLGRDYLTRTLYGGRVSIAVGVFTMIFAVILGTLYGTFSGYAGGKIDAVMMRFVDIFMSVPSMLLIIVINTFIKPSLFTIVVMIGLFAWTGIARIVRAETLSLRERDFILAAKNLGVSNVVIVFRHIIPNMTSQIIVAASISIARAILQESSLSFLGYGVQLPKASWGSMLQSAQKYILDAPLLSFIPGMFILTIVLSFNILGDALRNALEPKLRK